MGSSPPSGLRALGFFVAGVALLLWAVRPTLGLAATLLLALAYLRGAWLLGTLESLLQRCEAALRLSRAARRAGLLYCPQCGLHLSSRLDHRPLPHYVCPSCSGVWCGSQELCGLGDRLGARWKPDPPAHREAALPCPKCAKPLEQGGWVGAPITGHRCCECQGTWLSRLSWVWLEMDAPRT